MKMKMEEVEEEVEEVEEVVEEVVEMGKYIPDNELAESKKIMKGRKMYTINKNMQIVETPTVRCNPSSYEYDALKLFLDNNRETLDSYFNDNENNYGISVYACGFNGTAQDEFVQGWADNGVRVF